MQRWRPGCAPVCLVGWLCYATWFAPGSGTPGLVWGQEVQPADPSQLSVRARRAVFDQEYGVALARLAPRAPDDEWLHRDLADRQQLRHRATDRLYIFLPPTELPALPPHWSEDDVAWWQEYLDVRRRQAERLVQLAHEVATTDPAWAYQLLHEALWEYPDLEQARAALGYRRAENGWVYAGYPFQATLGRTAVPEFRLAPRQYQQVVTPHFRLLCESSAEAALQVAQELEQYHCVWRQVFFEYWGRGDLLAQRLLRGAPPAQPRREKHLVVWLADRHKYIDLLKTDTPQAEKTLGIYLDRRRAVLFFGDAQQNQTTRWHELTHQLFAETVPTAPDLGTRGNVWAIEGIALYMESLRFQNGWVELGGLDAPRLAYARYRAFQEKFYVPSAEFARLDRTTLQQDEHIVSLYSQAAGWAHFFMTAEDGTLRRPFIEYLKYIYLGRDQPESLWQLVMWTPDEMDRRYATFLQMVPATNQP